MNEELIDNSIVTDISNENKKSRITSIQQIDKPRVLVIDDNADICAYATVLLNSEYDVIVASNWRRRN